MEKPHLKTLPRVLPAVYEVLERVVDLYGYVSVDTNRYSVPECLVGRAASVHKHPAEIVSTKERPARKFPSIQEKGLSIRPFLSACSM